MFIAGDKMTKVNGHLHIMKDGAGRLSIPSLALSDSDFRSSCDVTITVEGDTIFIRKIEGGNFSAYYYQKIRNFKKDLYLKLKNGMPTAGSLLNNLKKNIGDYNKDLEERDDDPANRIEKALEYLGNIYFSDERILLSMFYRYKTHIILEMEGCNRSIMFEYLVGPFNKNHATRIRRLLRERPDREIGLFTQLNREVAEERMKKELRDMDTSRIYIFDQWTDIPGDIMNTMKIDRNCKYNMRIG